MHKYIKHEVTNCVSRMIRSQKTCITEMKYFDISRTVEEEKLYDIKYKKISQQT